ncbi:alpha/beta-hydrolase N-terminal domain-containing protein, partial [uncultured Propionibacterium sp.]|uniref:alpha/beta-hydrolase N-terminal domain-containing protein n=1 Tax=uncultured Propionibacterium sp. TaxID=218066 RepID=UPI00292EBBFE
MRLPRPRPNRLGVRRPHVEPPSVGGSIGALAGYVAAYAPSLLPRTWPFQGVVAALSSVFGYQVGMLAGWAAGLAGDVLGVRFDPARLGRTGRRALTGAALAAAVAAATPSHWPVTKDTKPA